MYVWAVVLVWFDCLAYSLCSRVDCANETSKVLYLCPSNKVSVADYDRRRRIDFDSGSIQYRLNGLGWNARTIPWGESSPLSRRIFISGDDDVTDITRHSAGKDIDADSDIVDRKSDCTQYELGVVHSLIICLCLFLSIFVIEYIRKARDQLKIKQLRWLSITQFPLFQFVFLLCEFSIFICGNRIELAERKLQVMKMFLKRQTNEKWS